MANHLYGQRGLSSIYSPSSRSNIDPYLPESSLIGSSRYISPFSDHRSLSSRSPSSYFEQKYSRLGESLRPSSSDVSGINYGVSRSIAAGANSTGLWPFYDVASTYSKRSAEDIMSGNNNSVFNLRSVLEKDKLNSTNFLDWERNLRIVLRCEGKESVIDTPIPELPQGARQADRTARQTLLDNSVQVTCLMLACMEPDFQKRFDGMNAYEIIQQLKIMFQRHTRLERFELNRKIGNCKLEKGKPVGPHVFNMIGHFQNMEKLGFAYPLALSIDTILNSLHGGFQNFCLNFYMQGGEVPLQELHGMLIQAKRNIPSEPVKEHKDVLMVQKGKGFKNKGGLTRRN